MKVYEKLVIDIETGSVIEEVSHEYEGPMALCKDDTPPAPEPTPTELALQDEQLAMLKEQRASQKELEPFMLEAMGYYRDDNGKIQKSTTKTADQILAEKNLALMGYSSTGEKLTEEQRKAYMTEDELSDYEITKLTKQRQLDALQGKLAVSPALEEELASEEKQMQETLARKLGPNWMLSTSGQTALKNLREKASLLREEARRGQISTGEGLLQSRLTQEQIKQNSSTNTANLFTNITADKLNKMMGLSSSKTMSFDNSTTLSSILGSDRANKQNLAMQNWLTNRNASTSTTNSAIGAGGVGAAAAAAAAAA